jgi:hypothetical protein
MSARRGRPRRSQPFWAHYGDAELLELRFRDLGLSLRGSVLETRMARLARELAATQLHFRPYVWLSSDWFTPDGHTGFAIPFYLAHPRLTQLERSQLLWVEGGSSESCMKLLRHETAHALDNAYRLHLRRSWRETFGPFSQPYRSSYVPRPASRNHVLNLDYWYAQSHPAEDWAETFAVWLQPGSAWVRTYAGWPALRKLQYVDTLMREIRRRSPLVRSRTRPETLAQLDLTLGEHYRRKKVRWGHQSPGASDAYLRRLFATDTGRRREPAARFLARHRRELRERVAAVTGQHVYLVDHVLAEMIPRCRELGLRLTRPEHKSRLDAAALLTALTMSFLRRDRGEYHR